jgi:Protein of unknown function (DUF2934)
MQLNKASKKTTKSAEKIVAAAPDGPAAQEPAAKPRVSMSTKTGSSKTKKSEGTEMTSGKNLHKSASPAVAEPGVANKTPHVEAKLIHDALRDTPSRVIRTEDIAELAYSYWVERGYTHGYAEDDWLRAENALRPR